MVLTQIAEEHQSVGERYGAYEGFPLLLVQQMVAVLAPGRRGVMVEDDFKLLKPALNCFSLTGGLTIS
ncbi:hypothetical protein RRG08_054197 [Elysia crispata]|uniref:Uncharacterized protein n=1 Tax=Elysia crispata TaxID=231223 RepID=A0AAE1A2B3_9GAST|nr:hypothetical protein RRG08_054197 [Elysia crispata]